MGCKEILIIILLCIIFESEAQKQSAWKQGTYYDKNNTANSGLISYAYSQKPVFRFKEDAASKETKLKATDVKGFIVEQDSFIVMNNFKVDTRETPSSNVPIDFVQVIETGDLMLYKHYFTVYTGGDSYSKTHGASVGVGSSNVIETYIIKRPLSGALWTIYSEPEKFKKQLIEIFHRDEVLLFKIKQGEMKYSDLPELVKKYNKDFH